MADHLSVWDLTVVLFPFSVCFYFWSEGSAASNGPCKYNPHWYPVRLGLCMLFMWTHVQKASLFRPFLITSEWAESLQLSMIRFFLVHQHFPYLHVEIASCVWQVFDITSLQIFSPDELDYLLCGRRELWEVILFFQFFVIYNFP